MQRRMASPKPCCIAKWQACPILAITVVRNGLRILLPALSSFQPFPSEMFGDFARCFKLHKAGSLRGRRLFFCGLCRPRRRASARCRSKGQKRDFEDYLASTNEKAPLEKRCPIDDQMRRPEHLDRKVEFELSQENPMPEQEPRSPLPASDRMHGDLARELAGNLREIVDEALQERTAAFVGDLVIGVDQPFLESDEDLTADHHAGEVGHDHPQLLLGDSRADRAAAGARSPRWACRPRSSCHRAAKPSRSRS